MAHLPELRAVSFPEKDLTVPSSKKPRAGANPFYTKLFIRKGNHPGGRVPDSL